MARPLEGVKVIEVGQAMAGPFAGVVLADMGADVIKIEKPDGGDDARMWGPPFVDDSSMLFHANNRSKRSVCLDLKLPSGVDQLKRLALDADILVQNLRPGVAEEIGIGARAMREVNPRLIYCSIWAFGKKGPLRDEPGFDPLAQAYGAIMSLTGRAEDPPTFCAPPINDKGSAMWCVIGALAALQQRQRTGLGCTVDTSLFESAVSWVETHLNSFHMTGKVPRRTGSAGPAVVPFQSFDTADGPMVIAAANDRLFARCAEALGHREWLRDARFATNPARVEHRGVLIPLMEAVLKTDTRAAWLASLHDAGVPCSVVNDIGELSRSDQLAALDMVQVLPGSDVKVVGLPVTFDGVRSSPSADSPTLGQHTEEVLGSLRYTSG